MSELNIVIKHQEIILNGVRYVPDFTMPNRLSIFLENTDDTTIAVYGITVKEILLEIKKRRLSNPWAITGFVALMHNEKEIKRETFGTLNLDHLKEFLESELVESLLPTNVPSAGVKNETN